MDQPQLDAKNTEAHSQIITNSPLVFISHDSRDNNIAEAFANLLNDVSGGILKSFRSSGRRGTTGIEFGAEWYRAIMEKLDGATDVVALLTPHSMDRPWILYESGFAKGKLNATVLGLAIGVPLDQVTTGPFAQFQNCGDDEDSLRDLVLQLVHRHSQNRPRDAAVRLHVGEFLKAINTVQTSKDWNISAPKGKSDDSSIARLFEEVKILVRNVPDQVLNQLSESSEVERESPKSQMYPRWITFTVSLNINWVREIYEIANPEDSYYDEEGPTPLQRAIIRSQSLIEEHCVIEECTPDLLAHFDMSEASKGVRFIQLYYRWKHRMILSGEKHYLYIDWWSEICKQLTLAIAAYKVNPIEVPIKSAYEKSAWYLPIVTTKMVIPGRERVMFNISLVQIPEDGELIKINTDRFTEDSKT